MAWRDRDAARSTGRTGRMGAFALGALAVGAIAIGAVAIGALAIGRLAIGRAAIGGLAVGRLSGKHAKIDRLTIGTLEVERIRKSRKPRK